jgi:hypothetical protein
MFAAELEYCLENNLKSQLDPLRHFILARRVRVGGKSVVVTFSAVRDNRKRSSARDLINDRYARRGYGSDHRIPSDDYHTTFTAEVNDDVISTITLAVDSRHGLAIDSTFSDVADKFREMSGTRICELTKLALEESIRSKEVLASLFHLAFLYGTNASDCTDLFIEVNPRHVRFYEAMLGFSSLGSPRANASVGAPSQLMHLEVETIGSNIYNMAGREATAVHRSLYPYFFPRDDERRLSQMLALARPLDGEPAGPHETIMAETIICQAA